MNKHINSNLTPAEQWRMHGTFNEETVDHLLNMSAAIEDCDIGWAKSALDEGMGCFPAEDALSSVINELSDLAKRVRGNNRDAVNTVIEKLADLQSTMNQDAEHGKEEITKVQKAIAAMTIR